MRLNQLSYLVAIERYGTISRAAEALYVSQPSISVAVRELEEELGYPLLVRNNRGSGSPERACRCFSGPGTSCGKWMRSTVSGGERGAER